ncbi:MAG: 6,7-dimethyl-8-ribityllumazine synthase [Planctomycetota bacterium]|jgi:6,7-dimethyl-8-ribityllumazine synthase|nr:6,7-dimethyl-8-ribityllumazine synthase [Planctomycetota bacterium]MDP6941115.1 6,7-dimethyl-8-ribityllumazine synthase [Planctomycetota bacterium]
MTQFLEGKCSASPHRFAVVVADFNPDITGALLEGSLHTFRTHGLSDDAVTVVRVPGAFEIPLTCDRLAASGDYAGIIALGAVIRGDTPHFDYVAGECARGVMDCMLRHSLPLVFGVLTTDTLKQAKLRASLSVLGQAPSEGEGRTEKTSSESNKGSEAAEVLLQMSNLLEQI